jgi:hypothetical protein
MSDFYGNFFSVFLFTRLKVLTKHLREEVSAADAMEEKFALRYQSKSFPPARTESTKLSLYSSRILLPKAHVRRATIEFPASCALAARHSSLFQRKTTRKCNAKHRRKVFLSSARDPSSIDENVIRNFYNETVLSATRTVPGELGEHSVCHCVLNNM